MGAIGEGMAAYAKPLLDQTDGSPEQLERAMTMAMMCWNMAVLPDAQHDKLLAALRSSLDIDDEQFAAMRRELIEPMIRRHRQMFPQMHSTRQPKRVRQRWGR